MAKAYLLTLDARGVRTIRAIVRLYITRKLEEYFKSPPPETGTYMADYRFEVMAILQIIDEMQDLLAPAHFGDAAQNLTGTTEGVIPVLEPYFSRLKNIVDAELYIPKSNALTPEEVEAIVGDLREDQDDLRTMFAAAEPREESSVPVQHYVSVGSTPRRGGNGTILN
jgi:hypothetical protein